MCKIRHECAFKTGCAADPSESIKIGRPVLVVFDGLEVGVEFLECVFEFLRNGSRLPEH
jgi:hypothetical protein